MYGDMHLFGCKIYYVTELAIRPDSSKRPYRSPRYWPKARPPATSLCIHSQVSHQTLFCAHTSASLQIPEEFPGIGPPAWLLVSFQVFSNTSLSCP